MKLSDILSEERSSSRRFNIIKLYQENNGWYRAYETSAYLLEFYPCSLSDSQRLRPTRRTLKGEGDGVISVGLKLDSLVKYAPGATPEMDGDDVIFDVDLSAYALGDVSCINDAFVKWKQSIPIKDEDSNTNHKGSKFLSNPVTFSSIFKKILSYNLKQHTDEDNAAFIEQLKEMAIQMI